MLIFKNVQYLCIKYNYLGLRCEIKSIHDTLFIVKEVRLWEE